MRVRQRFGERLESEAPQDRVVEAWSNPSGHDRNKVRFRTEYSGAAERTVGVVSCPITVGVAPWGEEVEGGFVFVSEKREAKLWFCVKSFSV